MNVGTLHANPLLIVLRSSVALSAVELVELLSVSSRPSLQLPKALGWIRESWSPGCERCSAQVWRQGSSPMKQKTDATSSALSSNLALLTLRFTE